MGNHHNEYRAAKKDKYIDSKTNANVVNHVMFLYTLWRAKKNRRCWIQGLVPCYLK